MTQLNFKISDHQSGGQKKGEGQTQANAGQISMSDAQLKKLISAATSGLNTSNEGANQDGQPQQQAVDPLQVLGIDAKAIDAMRDQMGDVATDALLKGLTQSFDTSETNSALLLDEIRKLSSSLEDKITAQGDALDQLRNQSRTTTFDALGLSDAFSEGNRDDLAEMLDAVSERSGGLLDARSQFDEALATSNHSYLAKVKDNLEHYQANKYKDAASLSGSNTASARSSVKSVQGVEQEIASLEKEIDQHLSGKTKDYQKVTELQEKVQEKLSELAEA